MSYEDAIFEIEELLTQMGFGISNLTAIQIGISEEILDRCTAGDALDFTCVNLHEIHRKLLSITESTIKSNRNKAN